MYAYMYHSGMCLHSAVFGCYGWQSSKRYYSDECLSNLHIKNNENKRYSSHHSFSFGDLFNYRKTSAYNMSSVCDQCAFV